MVEIQAPNTFEDDKFTIFLGGAIDQGQAAEWQKKVVKALEDLDVQVLNPRRDDWDSTLAEDSKELVEQIKWEIKAQDQSDLVIYVFLKDSKAPITFYELGRWGLEKPCLVCVEDGFYRKTNIEVYCRDLCVDYYTSLDKLLLNIKSYAESYI